MTAWQAQLSAVLITAYEAIDQEAIDQLEQALRLQPAFVDAQRSHVSLDKRDLRAYVRAALRTMK